MIEQSLKEGHSASACIVSESQRGYEKTAPSPATAPAGPSSFSPPSGSVENQPGALSREKPEATNVVPLSGFTSDSGHARDSSDITDNRESLTTPNAEFPIEANVPVAALREQEPDGPMSALKAVDGWPGFVAFLENHNPVLWAKVSHCAVKASGDILELEVPDMYEKSADGPEFIRKLEDASQAFFGSRLQWKTTIKKTSQTSRGAAAKGLKTDKLSGTKQIVNHPAVQQAIEILGAELIEVKSSKRI